MRTANSVLAMLCLAATACVQGSAVDAPAAHSTSTGTTTSGVSAVSVSPAAISGKPGQSVTVTAAVVNAAGAPVSNAAITWNSSNSKVAAVSATGAVTLVAVGTAQITATADSVTAGVSVAVTNTPAPVAVVKVTPTTLSLAPKQYAPVSASEYDSTGNILTGRAVAWTTSNANVATVSSSGIVTAIAVGSAIVTATSETKMATVAVTVAPAVASLAVTPKTASVPVGKTLQLTAIAKNAAGATVSSVSTAWSSANNSVASVSSGGVVSGVAAGGTTVTVTAGGLTVQAAITVTPASGGTATYPNQPSGYTKFAEMNGSAIPAPIGNSSNVLLGSADAYDITNSSRYGRWSVVSDATAPISPTSILNMSWPVGTPPGNEVALLDLWGSSGTQYKSVYESCWFKLMRADGFEIDQTAVKFLGYWGVGNPSSGGVELYQATDGNGSSTAVLPGPFTVWFGQQSWNTIYRRMNQNVDVTPRLTPGVWHQYELVMILDSSPGAGDGKLQFWIDGHLLLSYTDVQWRDSGHTAGFFNRHWDGVWGGAGSGNKTREDDIGIDHLYISGVPMS